MTEETNKYFGIVRNCIDGNVEPSKGIEALEEFAEFKGDFKEALRLMWFFVDRFEPCVHSITAAGKEKNKRWHAACELYQKYVGQL